MVKSQRQHKDRERESDVLLLLLVLLLLFGERINTVFASPLVLLFFLFYISVDFGLFVGMDMEVY